MTTGIFTGSFAAVIAGFIRDGSQLVKVAPDIILLSLRLGFSASQRASELEHNTACWAAMIPEISSDQVEKIIEEFNKEEVSAADG